MMRPTFRVREVRVEKDMTQAELIERSGVNKNTVIALENNTAVNVTVKTLAAIADALGVKVDDIVNF